MKILFLFFAFCLLAFSEADDCNCRIKTNNRIVNGQISPEHSIPWIVSLAEKKNHLCGGSILNEKYILTAAHCVDGKKVEDITVRVGIHNIKEKVPQNQIYKVKKIYSKKFKDIMEEGDIAILELSKKIKFSENVIEKGCYNLEKRSYTDQLLTAGWGMTNFTYFDPETKQMVYDGYPDNLKHAFFKEVAECKDFSICIKPVNDGDSPCHGDSGGPIHYTENGITKIEGVSSFVNPEKRDGKTYYCIGGAGYSRLSYYADWISEIADFNFCGTGPKTEPKYKQKKFLGLF